MEGDGSRNSKAPTKAPKRPVPSPLGPSAGGAIVTINRIAITTINIIVITTINRMVIITINIAIITIKRIAIITTINRIPVRAQISHANG